MNFHRSPNRSSNPLHRALRALTWALLCMTAITLGGCRACCSKFQNAAGVAHYRRGDHQAAVARFQRALAADPTNPDSYYNLAAAQHRMGKASGKQEDLMQAEQLYNQCLDRDVAGTHRECYRGLAALLVEEGRDDAAERLLEGWTERNPSSAAARVELARLYREMGDDEAERDTLLQAVALDPNDARAHAALGRLHDESGEPAQALANYERSLARNPMQRRLAARVASLRTAAPGAAAPSPPSDARMASRAYRSPRLN
jgi:tetratricopeptide (TPR) repeat protein